MLICGCLMMFHKPSWRFFDEVRRISASSTFNQALFLLCNTCRSVARHAVACERHCLSSSVVEAMRHGWTGVCMRICVRVCWLFCCFLACLCACLVTTDEILILVHQISGIIQLATLRFGIVYHDEVCRRT